MSGLFNWDLVPGLREMVDAIFEPGIRGIRCQKSAQIGWSESVLCNLLLYFIDMMPAPMIVLFPKLDKGKEFNLERFEPAISVTPRLQDKVPLTSREKGVTQTFKSFPGGWCKFVGSHSADAVKSSAARYVFVEEPDDCETDVKGQGKTVKLLRERLKTYYDTLSIMGGTPTLKGLSAIEEEMERTDKRRRYVPCHHCGEFQLLDFFGSVRWHKDASRAHPVYGDAVIESAYYVCSQCGGEWTQAQKDASVRRGKWVATAPFTGLAGFYYEDLLTTFSGASMSELVKKYLEAQHEAAQGDVKALVEFYNNQLGLPYEYKSGAPNIEELEARVEDYPEFTVPWSGLRLTMGADVQGDRIAIVIVAWGRGEESWRVYWNEIYGTPVDHNDPVWTELESFLFRGYRHESGAELHIEAASIDSGDGNTSDAVYWFCRKHRHRGVMATKGTEGGEIFRVPKPIDPLRKTRASKFGLQVYTVGTEKAKDLIIGFGENGGRLRLSEKLPDGRVATGRGPGRMHWYRGIRGDYFSQVTSEIKAPAKGRPRNKLYWQVKHGRRNEVLDCEGLALHASRSIKVNTWSEAQWSALEDRLRQPDLISTARTPVQVIEQPMPQGEQQPAPAEAAPANKSNNAGAAARPRPALNPLLAQLSPVDSDSGGNSSDRPY